MGDAHQLATDVVRLITARLEERAADLRHLAEGGAPFDGWLEAEAYLACRARQADYPFAEVAARPTYASEGAAADDGRPSAERGGLRVGGVGEPGRHRWVFAEFVVLLDRGSRGGPPSLVQGRALRLEMNRRTKDGSFLTKLVKLGLVKLESRKKNPFEATYSLTERGKHAAEYGLFEVDFEEFKKLKEGG